MDPKLAGGDFHPFVDEHFMFFFFFFFSKHPVLKKHFLEDDGCWLSFATVFTGTIEILKFA